jgi:hypothetical protein
MLAETFIATAALLEAGTSLEDIVQHAATGGGMTQIALETLEADLPDLLDRTVEATFRRERELQARRAASHQPGKASLSDEVPSTRAARLPEPRASERATDGSALNVFFSVRRLQRGLPAASVSPFGRGRAEQQARAGIASNGLPCPFLDAWQQMVQTHGCKRMCSLFRMRRGYFDPGEASRPSRTMRCWHARGARAPADVAFACGNPGVAGA